MQRPLRARHPTCVKIRKKSLLLLAILSASAAADVSLSLEDCVKMAKERSLDLESSRLSERASQASLESARASNRPTLSAHVNQSLYDSPFNGQSQDHYSLNMGITGSYTIWDGGSTGINIESRKFSVEAAKYNTELSALTVQESAMKAFIELLAAEEKRDIADSAKMLADSLVLYNSHLLEAGSITQSEFALVKSDAATAAVDQISARQTERSARTALRQILELGRGDSVSVRAPEASMESPEDLGELPSFDEVVEETRKRYPGLISDSLKILASEKNVEVAHKNSSITVSLGADASTGFSAWKSDRYARQLKNGYTHSVSLGINIPIIDGGTTSAKILSAQVEKEQAAVTRLETAKTLENNLEQLYMQAESADASWTAAIAGLESAQEAFNVAVAQRSVGAMSFTDFLEQKNKLQDAKSTLTRAKYTSILARHLLELYMGRFQ